MGFNFRVLAMQYPDSDLMHFAVHDVYYDERGKPNAYDDRTHSLDADTPKELVWMNRRVKEALKKPILWHGDKFPQEYKP